MNLADLRAELADRAAESHSRADLLPGVQRKVRTTRRNRRVAGSAVVVLALAAVAAGVLPGLTRDGSPEPAQTPTPPPDFVAGGVRFEGNPGSGVNLLKAFVGNPGQTKASFTWTPTTTDVRIADACIAEKAEKVNLRVTIGGVGLLPEPCTAWSTPTVMANIHGDSGIWSTVRPGKPTTVTIELVTAEGKPVEDSSAVLGLGISTSSPAERDPMLTWNVPRDPEDYVVDGFLFRKRIARDVLVKAAIGKPGENTLTFEFTPTSGNLRAALFCQGDDRFWVSAQLNDEGSRTGQSCGMEFLDQSAGGSHQGAAGQDYPGIKVGQPNKVTVRLTDPAFKPMAGPARIGIGIYELGPERLVGPAGNQVALPEVVESGGYAYRLRDVQSADATSGRSVSIPTPGGVPFLLSYGTTDTGLDSVFVQLSGAYDGAPMGGSANGTGQSTEGVPARKASTATVKITQGKPTRGTVFVAVYEPIP